MADGVIVLYYEGDGPTRTRALEVRKMRGTPHSDHLSFFEIYERLLSPENFEMEGEEWRREYIKAVVEDPQLSRFVYKICEIKKPSFELRVLNFKATMDSIKSGDLEVFARMPRPKQWKPRDEQDSDLKSLMIELEKEAMGSEFREVRQSSLPSKMGSDGSEQTKDMF